ncbi:type I restriction-modification system subunit M N-terminal domain-containing protein [Rhodopirellula sp. MGV]|uniref:type I restriction-modification system subunit M N-terminal domain-containing protein n=1 Tax=Rhodopirellula sp. MGV TaxID=2023130 RepID=UPI001E514AFF|nr:type I restriction-modification system subunit M [Rhodopirellula sp. MGV]
MTDNDLELQTLCIHLGEFANIIRGPVDAADYKTYIFPLLFFKRMCDVYDEEYTLALAESNGDEDYASFAENHCFVIPEDAHRNVVRETGRYVGKAIQDAMRKLESAIARMNCFLHGVEDFEYVCGDTLTDPKLVGGDRLRQFDVVLANPEIAAQPDRSDTCVYELRAIPLAVQNDGLVRPNEALACGGGCGY